MSAGALISLTGTIIFAGNVAADVERRLRSRLTDLCMSVGDFQALTNTAGTGTPLKYMYCVSYGYLARASWGLTHVACDCNVI